MSLPGVARHWKAISAPAAPFRLGSLPESPPWRNDIFDGIRIAFRRAVPNATAVGGHVDHSRIDRIGNDPLIGFEVQPGNAAPVFPMVGGPPDGAFMPGGVDDSGVRRVDGDVKDMLVAGENVTPAGASVVGNIDSAVCRHAPGIVRVSSPVRQVQPAGPGWIDGNPVWPVDP